MLKEGLKKKKLQSENKGREKRKKETRRPFRKESEREKRTDCLCKLVRENTKGES